MEAGEFFYGNDKKRLWEMKMYVFVVIVEIYAELRNWKIVK